MKAESILFVELIERSSVVAPTNKNTPENINQLKGLFKQYAAETGNATPSACIHHWSEDKGLIGDLDIHFSDKSAITISDDGYRLITPLVGVAA